MTPTGPAVNLGSVLPGGIAPGIYALVERGTARRPDIAAALRGEAELRYAEGFAPTRITFADGEIVVRDVGEATRPDDSPDTVIVAALPDLVQLVAAPMAGGVPKPTTGRGRAALASVAAGRVRISGSRAFARRLLRLMAID